MNSVRLTAAVVWPLLLAFAPHAEAKIVQKKLELVCSTGKCTASYSAVPAGKTLVVKAISCGIVYSAGTSNATGVIQSNDTTGAFAYYFPIEVVQGPQAVSGYVPVEMTIGSGKRPTVAIEFPNASTAIGAICNMRGSEN